MKFIKTLMKSIFSKQKKAKSNVIILGADYPEYSLSRKLIQTGDYQILFFIENDPWRHKTTFDNATCRYLSELTALCANYQVDALFYVDNTWPERIDETLVHLLRESA